MSKEVRYQLWIAAAAGAICFCNLGGPALFDMDEALYSTCAREMLQRDNWIVPWFNGTMFPEKPPLMFWSMMAGYEIFGINEWGARFFSAVMGVGTALAAFHLGRILFNNARIGLWAGLITASTIIFTISARAATVDSALTFVTTLAFLFFTLGWKGSGMGRGTSGEGRGTGHSGQWPVAGGVASGQYSGHSSPQPLASSPSSNPQSLIPNPSSLACFPLRYAIPMYACVGLAVLAKGPVGMLLPLAAMGVFLLLAGGWRKLFASAWWMRPFTAIVVVAAVAAPWYIAVGIQTDWEWPRKFFVEFNLRPFKQPILSHGDVSYFDRFTAVAVSILYYFYQVPAVLIGFFPWAVFLGPTIVETVRRLKEEGDSGQWSVVGGQRRVESGEWRVESEVRTGLPKSPNPQIPKSLPSNPQSPIPNPSTLLATCWFGTWFVFWSVCKTKLPHYLLPAYPALAILTACFIDRWLTEPAGVARWALRNAWISTIMVGVGIAVAIPIVAGIYLPGEGWIGMVGLILVVGGGWCWRETSRGRNWQAAVGFAVTSVAFLTAAFGFASLRVDKFQNAKPMIAAIQADWINNGSEKGNQPPIATFLFFRESTVFYAGYPVLRCEDETGRTALQQVAEFLAKSPQGYVITNDDEDKHVAQLTKTFPGRFKEIYRGRRFIGPGEMVILRSGGKTGN